MAAPTSGPYGTTALVYDTSGIDANPIGSPWVTDFTGAGGHSSWRRVTNEMAPATGGLPTQAYKDDVQYSLDSYGIEFWSQLPLIANTNGHFLDYSVPITDLNAAYDFYFLEITIASGDETWDISKITGGGAGSVLASGAQALTADDYIAFCLLPDGANVQLEAYWWNGGDWDIIVEVLDASSPLRGPGYLGLESTVGATWRIFNIWGGYITPEPTHLYHGIGGRGAGW